MTVGDLVNNIAVGRSKGNFGWLTWTGQNSAPTLAASLTPPGDSNTYVNPHNPTDRILSVGDWVQGVPGANNAKAVRDALDVLKTLDVVIPIWDMTEGQGANSNYRVSGFARVRLVGYQLGGKETISIRFLGYVTCGVSSPATAEQDYPRAAQDFPLCVFMPMIVR